jgi:hypothetical protein
MSGNHDLLAMLDLVEQFRQLDLGLVRTDRDGLFERNMVHAHCLDQSADWCKLDLLVGRYRLTA